MAVVLDAVNSNQGNSVATVDVSLTLSSSSDFLFAGGGSSDNNAQGISSVVFEPAGDNQSFTKKWDSDRDGDLSSSGWYLIAPASTGARTIRFTWILLDDELVTGVFSFEGVHQTTPLGTEQTANGSSTTAQVTGIVSDSDEIVVDNMYSFWNGGDVGTGQTEQWEELWGSITSGGGSTKTGEASTTMTWTRTAAGAGTKWAIGGVGIKPADVSPTDELLDSRRLLSVP